MITTTHDAHVSAPAAPMPRPRLAALTRLAALHWPRFALGAVLALAALLNVWALDRLGYANSYYAAAVKSMLQRWPPLSPMPRRMAIESSRRGLASGGSFAWKGRDLCCPTSPTRAALT